MAVNPSPLGPKPQFELSDGTPAVGNQLFFYVAGSVGTKQNTYTSSTGLSANPNPIVLNALGQPTNQIWFTAGQSYKVVYAPSTDTDPPTSPIWTIDNLVGINDTSATFDQWVSSGLTPTYISATSFSLVGDQTSTFQVNRRIKTTNTSGTIYSTITASVFGAVTTITVMNDSGVLDSGLSAVSYGLVSSTNTSLPPNLGMMTAKGDIVAGATGGRGVRVAVGSDGQALSADSSQTGGVVYVDNPSRPNLLVGANWLIDQINEGSLYTVNTTDVRGPDGWSGDAVGTGVLKLRTLADPDNAALKCMEISCTTADAAIGATDRYEVWTVVEGYDAAALQFGISSAQTLIYQFKLKSNSVTGVFGVYFSNSAGNRFYAGTITVSDTSEHEYTVTLTGDTTGTWLYTNGIGIRMGLVLAAGSNFQGTAGAWTASTVRTTSSQANFMSANTNIIYLKRGQLISGSLVQAYRPADIHKELAKAQRYYEKTFSQGTAVAQSAGRAGALLGWEDSGTIGPAANWIFATEKRAAPTLTTYSPQSASADWRSQANTNSETATATQIGTRNAVIQASTASHATTFYEIHATANARLS